MTYQLTLTDDEYAALAADATRRGQPVEAVFHALLAERYPALGEQPLSPAAAEEAQRLGLDPNNISPLGRDLLDLRAQAVAAGEHFLTWDELDAEIADRRGGIYPDADE